MPGLKRITYGWIGDRGFAFIPPYCFCRNQALRMSCLHPIIVSKGFHLCYANQGTGNSGHHFNLINQINRLTFKNLIMEKQGFNITIDAPRETVWDILWADTSYREWTSVFSEGSHAETDWKKGSKVLFLDGKGYGMVSSIAENIPNEFMSIRHLGVVKDGVEDLDSEKVREWAGAMENYTLKTVDGKTALTIEMDMNDEYKSYFMDTWPKALDKIKELAEKK
jgi:hypothetical protein